MCSYCYLPLVFDETLPSDQLWTDGVLIFIGYSVLMFVWVLLFRKLIAVVLIGAYVHVVLVIVRYLKLYS